MRDRSVVCGGNGGKRLQSATPSAASATSIHAFFKDPCIPPARRGAGAARATDVHSFFKTNAIPVPPAAPPQPQVVQDQPFGLAVEVGVYYATEYGFAKEIALEAALTLCSAFFRCHVLDLATLPRGIDWSDDKAPQAALFVCSTAGDGVPPNTARSFFDWLQKQKSTASLRKPPPPFSVCALGDRSYDKFCAAGVLLERGLISSGGPAFSPLCLVNKEDWTVVRQWVKNAVDALKALQLPPRSYNGQTEAPVAELSYDTSRSYDKERPFLAQLTQRDYLTETKECTDRETIRVVFDLAKSGICYLPGDALGVYALNAPEEVVRLCTALRLNKDSPVAPPDWSYDKSKEPCSVFEALGAFFDLKQPKKNLIQWLKMYGTAAENIPTNAESVERYLSERHVADVVFECALPPDLVFPIKDLHKMFRPLQPRLYSISSSPVRDFGLVLVCSDFRSPF